jgi:hypothetical protein
LQHQFFDHLTGKEEIIECAEALSDLKKTEFIENATEVTDSLDEDFSLVLH